MKTRWNINKRLALEKPGSFQEETPSDTLAQLDDHHFQMYDYIDDVTTSGPTCEDLGIPREDACVLSPTSELLQKPCIHTEFQRFPTVLKEERDPFSPQCMIPLPSPFGSSIFDSPCFRRRNERERDRVRCVNEGYLKLKQHLPIENKEKRLSKVETLRYAIKYIKYLENIISSSNSSVQTRHKNTTQKHNRDRNEDNVVDSELDLKFETDLYEDELEFTTDTSDYESKYDTSSEADSSG